MIVVGIIAIILTIALPTYSEYAIRARIAEALSVAAAAKTATAGACQEDRTLTTLSNSAVGYDFDGSSELVADVQISGSCEEAFVTMTTQNTGASGFDPVIQIAATFPANIARVSWTCSSNNTPNHLLPGTCRS